MPNHLRFMSLGNQLMIEKHIFKRRHRLVSNISWRNTFLAVLVKTYIKVDIKDFWFCLVMLNFLFIYQMFCLEMFGETILRSYFVLVKTKIWHQFSKPMWKQISKISGLFLISLFFALYFPKFSDDIFHGQTMVTFSHIVLTCLSKGSI